MYEAESLTSVIPSCPKGMNGKVAKNGNESRKGTFTYDAQFSPKADDSTERLRDRDSSGGGLKFPNILRTSYVNDPK